jgi:deoxyribodipyrimidine photolyase-related protein
VATEPASYDAVAMLQREGVTLVRTDQFLCHPEEFAAWAQGRKRLTMEDFYRWQRQRLGVLMDGSEPCGGRWNFDEDNREPPPKDGRGVARARAGRARRRGPRRAAGPRRLGPGHLGCRPRRLVGHVTGGALARLDHFIEHVLPLFGPHEDAMLTSSWQMAHGLISHALNTGLLLPGEVIEAAEDAYRRGHAPIASVEGFVRQVLGWREYVWGVYWLWMPEYRGLNVLQAHEPLPPAFTGAPTRMRCVEVTIEGLHDRAWAHHIQRLMVLGNLSLTAGVDPWAVTDWMWRSFVDGAEWVMLPNVIGMALHADGGRMATKPYASGGAYIDRMSDYCKGCFYDRTQRVGERACPFTTLYWDFLDRHRDRFLKNARVARQVRAADKLSDLPSVRERAVEVRRLLAAGEL